MERLTEEMQIGPFASLKDKAESVPGAFNTYDCFYAHAVAVTRLKQYEDTGLTPEEIQGFIELWNTAAERVGFLKEYGIDHLRELVQAEEDGRLVLLPCKAGDTLWTFSTYPRAEVYSFHVRDTSTLNGRTMLNTDRLGVIPVSDVGKTVFLTREEAEAALEVREGGSHEADPV